MIDLKIKLLTPTAKMPTKAHPNDACFDLYVDEPDKKTIWIKPGETVLLHSGIATEIPEGYFCAIYPRSGLGIKHNLRLPNGTGVIDTDYRGEWCIALYNDANITKGITHGDRVAQFAVLPVPEVNLIKVDELSTTERGSGGFGSSGLQ